MVLPTSRPWRQLFSFWPFGIPILWCVICQALLDPVAVTYNPAVPLPVKIVFYDESDLTAMALRGMNLRLGRLPGRPDEPAWHYTSEHFVKALSGPQGPYSERFYLEYPTASLLLFRLGFPNLEQEVIPTSVADGQQFFLAHHHPRDAAEERVWSLLNGAIRIYLIEMTVGLLGLMLILRWGYGTADTPGGPIWLLALPGAVYFALNRFDVWPALATAAAFCCIGRRQLGWGGAFLAIGVLLKVYPVVMIPVILRYLGLRRSIRLLTGFTLMLAGGVGLSTVLLDWESTIAPIRVQLNRAVEEQSWIFYGRVLPMDLAYWKTGRNGILAITILAMCVFRPTSLGSVLKRCVVILLVFNSLSVFWSPQWLIWFLPLLVPLVPQNRWAIYAIIANDLLNYASFPLIFWGAFSTFPFEVASVLAELSIWCRAFLTLAILGRLAWGVWVRANWYQRRLEQSFLDDVARLDELWLSYLRTEQTPRGLVMLSSHRVGAPLFVRDQARKPLALQPMIIEFEPVAGSEMESVVQARQPRLVTAIYACERGGWQPVRAIYNLTPEQVLEKFAGQFEAVNRSPK